MAGKPVRRTTHAHMHFRCASFAQVHHTRARRGATHDRVVHNHDAFPGDHFLDQIEFHSHVEIADQLARLQKCSTDVVVAHERMRVRDV